MSMTDFARPNGQGIPARVNSGVIPRFYEEQIETKELDPETGLPQYRTQEFVELNIPGDLKQRPVHRVGPGIIAQYPAEYEAWKRSGKKLSDMVGTGFPLAHWPQLPKPVAASLAHANVFTVEQLARLSDTQCQINGAIGIRKYRDMAAAFIQQSAAAAPIATLSSEVEALKNQIALRDKQIEQLIEVAEAAKKKADGTPDIPDLSTPRDETRRGQGRPRRDQSSTETN